MERWEEPGILVDPLKAATWLTANGLGKTGIPISQPSEPKAKMKDADAISNEAMLHQLRQAAGRSLHQYQLCLRGKDAVSTRASLRILMDIISSVQEVQKTIDERERLQQEILGDMLDELRSWCEPVRALLDGMPIALGSQCNPADPTRASSVLDGWVQKQLLPLMSRDIIPDQISKPTLPTHDASAHMSTAAASADAAKTQTP